MFAHTTFQDAYVALSPYCLYFGNDYRRLPYYPLNMSSETCSSVFLFSLDTLNVFKCHQMTFYRNMCKLYS